MNGVSSPDADPAAPRRISVVVPVHDESENIGPCLRGLARALAGAEHEILVCYDSDEDATLSAIEALTDRPPSLRLVKNGLGPGAANALRAGFAAATGDVVVTSMADLSDPPEAIPALAERVRAGAAVVSGSRYMPGGSMSGGPRLKRTLSRWACLSLWWLAGVRTRDATNNFRAYDPAFLRRVEVESDHAFDLALELTVKAHLAGEPIDEVPSSWTDRSAGASRFRVFGWMPFYLRWWARAMARPALVLAVAGALIAAAARGLAPGLGWRGVLGAGLAGGVLAVLAVAARRRRRAAR